MDIKQLDGYASLLFDTGKRNNLISFKNTSTASVEIIAPDAQSIFKLAERAQTLEVFNSNIDSEEEALELVSDEKTTAPTLSGTDEEIYSSVKISKKDYAALYKGRMKKNHILIYNSSLKPMDSRRAISKKGLSALEESGVNLLYLAIGFIHWTESESSNCFMKAPLLLVGVTIENSSPILPAKIKIIDDEIIVNPAFMHKMHAERGIDLPEYDEEVGIEGYFEKVREITDRLNWKLEYESRIGLFSFQKINMYRDIKENGEKIIQSPAMKRMLGEAGDESINSVEKDEKGDVCRLHNVVDADSSQSSAIEMAKSGKSFVIRMPLIPGVTDTEENLRLAADLLRENGIGYIELLPYNKMAGAKYSLIGEEYSPSFDTQRAVEMRTEIFERVGIKTKIL